MFELPELMLVSSQMNGSIMGKVITQGSLGNAANKFVWYNRSPEEFSELTRGKCVGAARVLGKWLLLDLEPGYVFAMGECGGKLLYHPPGSAGAGKYHLYFGFDDGSFLTIVTQMWGALELHEKRAELQRQFIKDQAPAPLDKEFTLKYFSGLINRLAIEETRSVKGLLTQDKIIPGLGNAICQDILFNAGLHPRRLISELTAQSVATLHAAIVETTKEIIRKGGRHDEVDLFGNAGGYTRIMDKNALSKPCPRCKGRIDTIQFLGGSCYFCSACQR